jgi:hypothetical protein
MHYQFFTFLLLLSFSKFSAQSCLTKSDFAKIQKLNIPEAKKYLSELFYNSTPNEYQGRTPICAEEKIGDALGFAEVGFDAVCYYDYNGDNSFVLYQIKNNNTIFLYECTSNCYYSLFNECQRTLKGEKQGSNQEYAFISYPIGALTLEFRSYHQNEIPFRVLLYNKSQVQAIWTTENNKFQEEQRLIAIEAQKDLAFHNRIDSIKNLAESFVVNGLYLEAKMKFSEALSLEYSFNLTERITYCEQMLCLSNVNLGDQFLSKKQYKEALISYEIAKGCLQDKRIAEEKIKFIQKQMMSDSISRLVTAADAYFNQKRFQNAREAYLNIKRLDPSNNYAAQRIKEIDDLIFFLAERKVKTYDYFQIDNSNVAANRDLLQKELVKYINPLKKGELQIQLHYLYDTLGMNLSQFKLDGSSATQFKPTFGTITSQFQMVPPQKKGYFISAEGQKEYDIQWQTQTSKYRYTSKGVAQKSGLILDESSVKDYFNRTTSIYGTYTLASKSITVNSQTYTNVQIALYKAKAGPANVIYSMMLPGLGTMRVTYGEKGKGRMISFLLAGSVAYLAKSYSNEKYALYLNTTGAEAQTYYDQANSGNQLFLASIGFATTIYVYDFFHVIGRGFKNTKQNKLVKNQIPGFAPYQTQYFRLEP